MKIIDLILELITEKNDLAVTISVSHNLDGMCWWMPVLNTVFSMVAFTEAFNF